MSLIWKILAMFDFPLRDPSRPRARGIGMIATRDLAEPRCVPSTTRFPRDVIFPPTNGFVLFFRVLVLAIPGSAPWDSGSWNASTTARGSERETDFLKSYPV